MTHVLNHRGRSGFTGSFSLLVALSILLCGSTLIAQQPQSLMTVISQWRYPDAKISGSTLQDAATVNENGVRTEQSIQYKTVMTTTDPLSVVYDYYKKKLVPPTKVKTEKDLGGVARGTGRSITFHEDSEGRPVEVRIININAARSSTTLVISRGAQESETHIAWTRYVRF